MDAIFIQILNGLDKGAAYALIALGLTLAFGTLGVVNFAHGALFMLGAFCAVSLQKILTISERVRDESVTFFEAYKEVPYLELWWGDTGKAFFNNWLGLVYRLTHLDRHRLFMEGIDPDDPLGLTGR